MDEPATAYEAERAALIARNRERLRALGLEKAAAALGAAAPGAAAKPVKATAPRVKREAAPAGPRRSSKRLRGGAAPKPAGPLPAELRSPTPEPAKPKRQWTEEALQQFEAEKQATLEARLSELDAAGLIDHAPAPDGGLGSVARFAVVGAPHKAGARGRAARKHYVVTLHGGRPGAPLALGCGCMDYRCRKNTATHYACKVRGAEEEEGEGGWHGRRRRPRPPPSPQHLRLILSQLGCGEAGAAGWEGALEARVMAGAVKRG